MTMDPAQTSEPEAEIPWLWRPAWAGAWLPRVVYAAPIVVTAPHAFRAALGAVGRDHSDRRVGSARRPRRDGPLGVGRVHAYAEGHRAAVCDRRAARGLGDVVEPQGLAERGARRRDRLSHGSVPQLGALCLPMFLATRLAFRARAHSAFDCVSTPRRCTWPPARPGSPCGAPSAWCSPTVSWRACSSRSPSAPSGSRWASRTPPVAGSPGSTACASGASPGGRSPPPRSPRATRSRCRFTTARTSRTARCCGRLRGRATGRSVDGGADVGGVGSRAPRPRCRRVCGRRDGAP